MKMLNFYKISIDPNDDETGMFYNSFVDVPAHMKAMIAFDKKQAMSYHFDAEKRIVTGVFISVGTPIERNDSTYGRHYVVFEAEDTTLIKEKFHKANLNHNVNIQHNPSQIREGVFLVESYQVGLQNSPGIPEAFKGQNLQPGTWIGSYKVENNSVWADVKSGKFMGFSIEGMFFKDLIKIKKSNTKINMSKKTKTVWEILFGKNSTADKFDKATTTDGVVLMWEGELAEQTPVFIEVEGGEPIPAPEGDHQITLEDGTVKVVTIDAAGLVTAVVDEEKNTDEGIREEVADAMKKILKDTNDRFSKMESERAEDKKTIEGLKAEIEAMKSAKDSKFAIDPMKRTDDKKLSVSEILANKLKK